MTKNLPKTHDTRMARKTKRLSKSFHDLASKVCGAGSKGIKELSTNPVHLNTFGQ